MTSDNAKLDKTHMTKYGVCTKSPKQKCASYREVCPLCGKQVEKYNDVVKCPVHGTEPFELY